MGTTNSRTSVPLTLTMVLVLLPFVWPWIQWSHSPDPRAPLREFVAATLTVRQGFLVSAMLGLSNLLEPPLQCHGVLVVPPQTTASGFSGSISFKLCRNLLEIPMGGQPITLAVSP